MADEEPQVHAGVPTDEVAQVGGDGDDGRGRQIQHCRPHEQLQPQGPVVETLPGQDRGRDEPEDEHRLDQRGGIRQPDRRQHDHMAEQHAGNQHGTPQPGHPRHHTEIPVAGELAQPDKQRGTGDEIDNHRQCTIEELTGFHGRAVVADAHQHRGHQGQAHHCDEAGDALVFHRRGGGIEPVGLRWPICQHREHTDRRDENRRQEGEPHGVQADEGDRQAGHDRHRQDHTHPGGHRIGFETAPVLRQGNLRAVTLTRLHWIPQGEDYQQHRRDDAHAGGREHQGIRGGDEHELQDRGHDGHRQTDAVVRHGVTGQQRDNDARDRPPGIEGGCEHPGHQRGDNGDGQQDRPGLGAGLGTLAVPLPVIGETDPTLTTGPQPQLPAQTCPGCSHHQEYGVAQQHHQGSQAGWPPLEDEDEGGGGGHERDLRGHHQGDDALHAGAAFAQPRCRAEEQGTHQVRAEDPSQRSQPATLDGHGDQQDDAGDGDRGTTDGDTPHDLLLRGHRRLHRACRFLRARIRIGDPLGHRCDRGQRPRRGLWCGLRGSGLVRGRGGCRGSRRWRRRRGSGDRRPTRNPGGDLPRRGGGGVDKRAGGTRWAVGGVHARHQRIDLPAGLRHRGRRGRQLRQGRTQGQSITVSEVHDPSVGRLQPVSPECHQFVIKASGVAEKVAVKSRRFCLLWFMLLEFLPLPPGTYLYGSGRKRRSSHLRPPSNRLDTGKASSADTD
ncbi:hypothetical protein [Corynebacterium efficiens YS-314]|uniref:Uncharacterized protein n=1 Tax=Corynebacterium efficiens (strain DSM 44549 / YS-314 / AJ 12310 / JCM 11189 / NBRC 100395) TaxID=196164 RepID=Q8FTQ3_COREF|nr:hypothetical protein [Corynebacterium efficiens YS-314]